MINTDEKISREELLNAYFSTNYKFYNKVVRRYEEKGKYTFNIWSAIFPMEWMIYRKMYKQAILLYVTLFAIHFILGIIPSFIESMSKVSQIGISLIEFIVLFVPMGYAGSYFYTQKAIDIVDTAMGDETYPDNNSRMKSIRDKGNTDPFGVVAFIFVSFIISTLLALIFAF